MQVEFFEEGLGDEPLAQLTQAFCDQINFEGVGKADILEGKSIANAKGEPITVGLIVLTLIKSGAAVAIFNALKAYFESRPKLRVRLKAASGDEFELTATNLDAHQLEDISRALAHESRKQADG